MRGSSPRMTTERISRTAGATRCAYCALQLQKPLVVADKQIPDRVRDRKTVSFAKLQPLEAAGLMMVTCVDLSTDHFQRQFKRLHGVDTGAPTLHLSLRPADLEPANPVGLGFFGRV